MQGRKQSGEDPANFISAFAGDDHYIVDYLVDEVLSRQPKGTRDFLLWTSILDRMTGPLCDAITRQEGGQGALRRLEEANLFVVPLDNKRQWYRYHHLFADLLRHRLRATQSGLIPELYRRASAWYESGSQMDQAIQYALAAEDPERAARLLDGVASSLVYNSEYPKLLRWINALPKTACQVYPRLCIFHALALQFATRLDAVEPILALAEAHLQAEPASAAQATAFPANLISSHAAMARAYVARKRGELDRAVELSQRALEIISKDFTDDDARRLRGAVAVNLGIVYKQKGELTAADCTLREAIGLNRTANSLFATLASVAHLMQLRIVQGQLHQAHDLGRQGLEWTKGWGEGDDPRGPRLLAVMEIQVEKARVLYEWNDLMGVADLVDWLAELQELTGDWYLGDSYGLHVYLNQAQGDVDAALGYLEKLESLNAEMNLSHIHSPIGTRIVRQQLLLSRSRPDLAYLLSKASQWVENAGLNPGDAFDYMREHRYAALARVLIAQEKAG